MKISESEAQIMMLLWETPHQTAEELAQKLSHQDWTSATIKTFLNRLKTKGAIDAIKEGRKYRYRPILTKDAYFNVETESILSRLFDGKVSNLVSHFSTEEKLDQDEIDTLKKLIDKMENES